MASPLVLSLQVAFLSTAVTTVAGIAMARAMTGLPPRLRHAIEGVFLLPLVLPPTVLGYLLLLALGHRSPLGRLCVALFGGTPVFTWWGAVIASTVVSFPLMYTNARAALGQADPRVLQAARMLGAGPLRTFFAVHLPLAWPGLLAGVTLSYARSLGEFGATLMLAGNLPGRTTTMPIALYFDVEAGDEASAMSWATCMVLISVALLSLLGLLRKQGRERRF